MARQSHVRFTIPEPCNVPWDGMTPVDSERRHCASCDKVIVDFSKMNDDELMLYFRHSKGKVCGRFDNRQLDRRIPLLPERTQKAKWWRALALLPLILFSRSARAQYEQVVNDSIPPDTAAVAKETIVPDTLVAKQEQLSQDTTPVAKNEEADSNIVMTPSSPKNSFDSETELIMIDPQNSYGSIVITVGNVYIPENLGTVGFVNMEFPCPVYPEVITDGSPAFEAPDITKSLTDKEQKAPEPQQPALPASNEITGVLPEERRKPWKR